MATSQLDNQKLRQVFFLSFLVFMFIFLFLQMNYFIPGFLGAVTLYVLLRKSMAYLVEKKKWKNSLAASLLLLLSFLIVLVPVFVTINILSSRIGNAIQNSHKIVDSFNALVKRIENQWDISIMQSINPGDISSMVANTLTGVMNATVASITTIAVMYFVLYFMLVSRSKMEKWIFEFIPLKDENVAVMGKEMKGLVISNALGIPLVALLQGIVGLIAYLILGVNDIWFWFIFTCIASMLPFVGAALAYVPLSIILYVGDQQWQAIFLLLYGFGIIGTVDNVFRFILQKKMGDVHPLITVFGVIIGINLFGFIGLIFGPILISMFILMVKIYMSEFVNPRAHAQKQLKV